MEKLIFHVDMNSFFASCEEAADPEIKGKPIIVCGDPAARSGIVLAASYAAKRMGVYTTQLIGDARKVCPHGVFLPARHGYYCEVSRKVMAILDRYTPLKEQASVDEAYLDMTGSGRLFGDPVHAAMLIQTEIKETLDIGCSIGISTNKLLAKMGSDMKKPMGITELYPDMIEEKMWPLPVKELFGVGKKTAEKLRGIGINTIGDITGLSEEYLIRMFGPASAKYLYESSRGIGADVLVPAEETEAKSMGNETTFSHDLTDREEISKALLMLSESVGRRLRKHGKKALCLTVKIKYSDFTLAQRSRTLQVPFDTTDTVYDLSKGIFFESWSGKPVRLLGVSASELNEGDQMMLVTDGRTEKAENLDKSIDEVRKKFGWDSIGRASLLDSEKER